MAMVALFRPGPMQVIPEFIKRKHDPSQITYPDPRLKPVLKQSYGLITYQDDVLLTSIALAGYSWGEADKLRKAVGKKIPSEMKIQREKFITRCVENGLLQSKAEEIFNLIEPFAGYGFNKAHAASYAMIAYQTAYLKAHYPVEFMTAVFTAESRANTGPLRDEKISSIVVECRRVNVTLLPPDVNKSVVEFSVEKGNIRFGLSAVKNVGAAAIEVILKSRESRPFVSFADFLSRVDLSKVNKKTIESLIKAGGMDEFGNRASLLSVLTDTLELVHKKKKANSEGQVGLFESQEDHIPQKEFIATLPEIPRGEKLSFEKELLGFYLTEHPLMQYQELLAKMEVKPVNTIDDESVGQRCMLAGMVTQVKKIMTKASNSEMAFMKLEDLSGIIEVVVFPKIYAKKAALVKNDAIVQVLGKIDKKDDRFVLLADDIHDLKGSSGLL
jgi:DNA polymerase-3 subunit alpha